MAPSQKNQENSTNPIIKNFSAWALVIIIQSMLSIIWLLLIPKEPGNAEILGYSLRRLALLIPMSMPLFAGAIMRVGAKKKADWLVNILSAKKLPGTASMLVLGGAFLATSVWSFLFLSVILNIITDLGAIYRLIPWLASFFLIGLEAVLFVPTFIYPKKSTKKPGKMDFPIRVFLITFFLLLATFILIEITGLGKNPVRVSIISLGVPILEGQIWYIFGLLAIIIPTVYAWHTIPSGNQIGFYKRGDLVIAAILWLVAVTLWMSLPLPSHNYFAPEVQPPNFEKYPFSDAEQYDFNSLYVYFGSLENFVVSKPMYVSFLAILHAIGGLSYANIVLLQTLVVALFPSVLYLIGRELHSRLGGIAIALFAIFREVSSIQASSIANTSNTKLLLSDMPAALLAAILALTLIRWLKVKEKRISGHEFLIGGLIGFFILTRIQTMLLVPFALMLVVLRHFGKFKLMLVSTLIMLAALTLVVTPILIRNHSITGVYWIDNPSSSRGLSRFLTTGLDVDEDPTQQPSNNIISNNMQVFRNIVNNYLGEYFYAVADNFSRNSISSILILPVRLGNRVPFIDYIRVRTPFWAEVYSLPNMANALVVIFNLVLIALGFSKSFKRNSWTTATILGFYVVYSLSSALVRLSGWRFILPLEWVIFGFYALGAVEAMSLLFRRFTGWDILHSSTLWFADYPDDKVVYKRGSTWYAAFGLIFLVSGALITIRERLLPSRLPEYSTQEVCRQIDTALADSEYSDLRKDFMTFCLSKDTRAMKGYAFYPRYFSAGEGYYSRTYDPWFGRQDYSRLVFRLVGVKNAKIYIKTEMEAARIPNGSIVFLVGREKANSEAQFVLIDGPEPELIISSSLLEGEANLIPLN